MRIPTVLPILLIPLLVVSLAACAPSLPADAAARGDYRKTVRLLRLVPPGKRAGAALAAGREAFIRGDYAIAADLFDRAGADGARSGALAAASDRWIEAHAALITAGEDSLAGLALDRGLEAARRRDDPALKALLLSQGGREEEARNAWREAGDRYATLKAWDLAETAYRRAGEDTLARQSEKERLLMAKRIERAGGEILAYLDLHLGELSDETAIAGLLDRLAALEGEIGGRNTGLALRWALGTLSGELERFETDRRDTLEEGGAEALSSLTLELGEYEAKIGILTRILAVYETPDVK